MKHKKKHQHRFINGTKGAISILLCLIMTPILTIALGLVEYARVQSLIETTNEVLELTGLSSLMDYDTYLNDRFGLMSVSQSQNLTAAASQLLTDNNSIMGNQMSFGSCTAKGTLSLDNAEVLKRQIIDVAELTGTSAVILDDFKLQELLAKLKVVEQLSKILETVEKIADLTDAVREAVEAAEALEIRVNGIITKVGNIRSNANALAERITKLCEKLAKDGIKLPSGVSEAEMLKFLEDFVTDNKSTLDEIQGIYADARKLYDDIKSLKTDYGKLKTDAETFVNAVEKAEKAIEGFNTDSGTENGNKASAATTETLNEILKQMDAVVKKTLADIKADSIQAAQDALQNFIDETLAETGLKGITSRYWSMINGEYFTLPLSDAAKSDLKDILKLVPAAWDEKSYDALLAELKSMFYPSGIDLNINQLSVMLKNAIKDAKGALEAKVKGKVAKLLADLVSLVKKIFNLQGYYNPELNAFIEDGVNMDNGPYQKFLDGIRKLYTAVEEFVKNIKSFNFIKALGAVKDFLTAIKDLIEAIVDKVRAMAENIGDLASSIAHPEKLRDRFIVASYMRHNLPCRTNAGDLVANPGATLKTQLKGTGLTGFSYDKIPRPVKEPFKGDPVDGFTTLIGFVKDLTHGGTDKMFRGAELEYICAGTKSEIANQIFTFMDLYFLRMVLDLPSILITDTQVAEVAVAATIASWAVYLLYIVIEPFLDVIILVNGGEVPLFRTKCYLTATGVTVLIEKLGSALGAFKDDLEEYASKYASGAESKPTSSGALEMKYATYVMLSIMINMPADKMVARFADLVNLEASEYYRTKGGSFSMSKTYAAVELTAEVTYCPFFDIGLLASGSSIGSTYTVKRTVGY